MVRIEPHFEKRELLSFITNAVESLWLYRQCICKKNAQNALRCSSRYSLYRTHISSQVRLAQSSSSPDSSSSSSFFFCSRFLRSPFLPLSSFSHILFAASLSRSGKTMSKTSLYHWTGRPSMPSLMFCHILANILAFIENRRTYLRQLEPIAHVVVWENDRLCARSPCSNSLLT